MRLHNTDGNARLNYKGKIDKLEEKRGKNEEIRKEKINCRLKKKRRV
jgi:hypothetical protein